MTELINQGGFGCIFYPAFNCKNNFNKYNTKFVSKLQIDNFNTQNEINIGKIIVNIPNFSLYFLPVISSCNITLASIDPQFIDKCDIIERNIDNYKLLELPYLENISFQQLFSDTNRSTRHLFLTFIETYRYLSISIANLIEHKIVHYDIKEQNILYSTKYENPILIDFGISISIDNLTNSNLKQYFYTYAPQYSIWPLEVHIINYILHKGNLTKDSIKYIIETYIDNNSIFNNFTDNFKQKYITTSINYFSQFLKIDNSTIIIKLLDFYHTWDLYSLSIIYIKFLHKLFNKGYFNNKFLIAFTKLLIENISPIPENRNSTKNTQTKYNNIFYLTASSNIYNMLIDELEK